VSELQKRIKQRRLECGYTLAEVAELIDVKEATVQRYESGEIKNIKHDTIVSLANIFKCSPAYLMGWTDDGTSDSTEYKKEDAITDIFKRLRTDTTFYEAVKKLYALDEHKLNGVISMLSSFE
jgi:transcriptional regulator with XRE-family HTH domain